MKTPYGELIIKERETNTSSVYHEEIDVWKLMSKVVCKSCQLYKVFKIVDVHSIQINPLQIRIKFSTKNYKKYVFTTNLIIMIMEN